MFGIRQVMFKSSFRKILRFSEGLLLLPEPGRKEASLQIKPVVASDPALGADASVPGGGVVGELLVFWVQLERRRNLRLAIMEAVGGTNQEELIDFSCLKWGKGGGREGRTNFH